MRRVKTISVSIPEGLVELLRAEAEAVGVSVSSLVTVTLYNRYKSSMAAYGADVKEVLNNVEALA